MSLETEAQELLYVASEQQYRFNFHQLDSRDRLNDLFYVISNSTPGEAFPEFAKESMRMRGLLILQTQYGNEISVPGTALNQSVFPVLKSRLNVDEASIFAKYGVGDIEIIAKADKELSERWAA